MRVSHTGCFRCFNKPVVLKYPHLRVIPFPVSSGLFRSSIQMSRLLSTLLIPAWSSPRLVQPSQYLQTSSASQGDIKSSETSKKIVSSSSTEPKIFLRSTAETSSLPVKSWWMKKHSCQAFSKHCSEQRFSPDVLPFHFKFVWFALWS